MHNNGSGGLVLNRSPDFIALHRNPDGFQGFDLVSVRIIEGNINSLEAPGPLADGVIAGHCTFDCGCNSIHLVISDCGHLHGCTCREGAFVRRHADGQFGVIRKFSGFSVGV